jgi:hypothetical protein
VIPPPGFDALLRWLEGLAARSASGIAGLALTGRRVVLHLQEGQIVRVEEGERQAGTLLAQLAIRRGLVSAVRLTTLLEDDLRSETGRILQEAGLVEAGGLADLRALQVEELLGPLALEPVTSWTLDDAAVPQPQPGLQPIPLRELLADLRRRVSEWPVLLQRFPAQDCRVLLRAPEPSPESLTPRQQELLARIRQHGRPTVGTLLAESAGGVFATLRQLFLLLEGRWIQLEGDPAEVAERDRRAQEAADRRLARGHQSTTGLLAAVAFVLVVVGLVRWLPDPPTQVPWRLEQAAWRQQVATQDADRVRIALEVCRLVDGRLPQELRELEAGSCLPPGLLPGEEERPDFQYERTTDTSFLLLPVPR